MACRVFMASNKTESRVSQLRESTRSNICLTTFRHVVVTAARDASVASANSSCRISRVPWVLGCELANCKVTEKLSKFLREISSTKESELRDLMEREHRKLNRKSFLSPKLVHIFRQNTTISNKYPRDQIYDQ